ncbi:MAG: hypothetical protein CMJ78_22195 [Planctomycetaceae bacterium]|nr:hypothetical protein [Planctomycetaceae bacterium]
MKNLRTFLIFAALASCSHVVAQDMPLTQVLIDGEDWEVLSIGHRFTEGPAVDKDGNVFFTDIPNDQIFKIDTKGKVSLFVTKSGRTNGLMIGPDGRLYGCRNGDKKIVAYSMNGEFETIADGVTCNDLVVNSSGGIYFTDPPEGKVHYITPDGKRRVVASDMKPNGVILWANEGTLVVTDAVLPHLWTFRVEADGSLSHKERYYMPLQLTTSSKRPGSDGMTIDNAGRLYVTTRAGLQMFDPTGRMGGVIAKPQPTSLSNVCFGGPGLRYLYVTARDKVYRRYVKPTGVPYFLRAQTKAK